MYGGGTIDMGPMALLSIGGVSVIVASKASQTADQAILRHVGIEPDQQAILALKSVVHFRNDFAAKRGDRRCGLRSRPRRSARPSLPQSRPWHAPLTSDRKGG
jgi:hypothetical protein